MSAILKIGESVQERRRFERRPSVIRVEMIHPSWGTMVGFTTDISDGGAHVSFENAVAPPVGTEMQVTFKKVVGNINNEPVNMKVVRVTKKNLALMFSPRS